MRAAAPDEEHLLAFEDDDAYTDLWSLWLWMSAASACGLLWQCPSPWFCLRTWQGIQSPHVYRRKPTCGKGGAPSEELLNTGNDLTKHLALSMRRITHAPAEWEMKKEASRSGQVMSESESYCCRAIFARRFVENMGEVMGDSFLAQPQFLSHLAIGEAFCQQAQHLYLTSC